jgi:hypothetical protein
VFWRKPLYQRDPKTLSLDHLSHLQASLVAKLMLVNLEIFSRYRRISDISAGLPDSNGSISTLTKSADHLEQINIVLNSELGRITGRKSEISN